MYQLTLQQPCDGLVAVRAALGYSVSDRTTVWVGYIWVTTACLLGSRLVLLSESADESRRHESVFRWCEPRQQHDATPHHGLAVCQLL